MKRSPNDHQRLEILRRYEILDTFPEASFERLTRLVANIFGTPIALISLIDEARQWFKSHHGLDASETPLHVSFCRHAIENEGVFMVPDATKDDRFATNPLVTGDPGIRFYAGAPLRTPSGAQVGTLCVIDQLPRRALRATEQQMLTDLAAIVVDEMELRLALRQAQRQEQMSPRGTKPNGTSQANNREESQS
jgi:GAF domain-containing protein